MITGLLLNSSTFIIRIRSEDLRELLAVFDVLRNHRWYALVRLKKP